jgi:hypothetical protein
MAGSASDRFTSWVREDVAPIAHANGLTGTGLVFRRREGPNWILFALERRRIEPQEATTRAADPHVDFRMIVGVHVPATRLAWDTSKSRPLGIHDIGPRSPSLALEPPDGESWHTFHTDDEASRARLTELIQAGIPEALHALGRVDARAMLERKLAFAGPLENLAPGHAEELLALADEAGAADIRRAIVEALRREPVPDPTRPSPEQLLAETRELFPDAHLEIVGGWPIRAGTIHPPFPIGRRVAKTRAGLLADLAGGRVNARRIAATRLAGWTGEPEIASALRAALDHPDGYTRLTAASSLGHLGDADPATWRRVLGLIDHAAPGPRELGEAIVLLARLDLPGRRQEAVRVLHELADRYPAWTRDLLAFARDVEGEGF